MKYRSYTELAPVARVIRPQGLSKRQRLLRWASALESSRGTQLNTFKSIEHKPRKERSTARVGNSPLTVAFEDPVLQSAGLSGDSFGEVAQFFGLSHWQLHALVCHCHHGKTVAADRVALRVRRLANQAISLMVALSLLATMIAGAMLLSKALQSLVL